MKELTNRQDVVWNLLRRHYQEFKVKRNDLKAEYLRQVERDMVTARETLAAEIQDAFEVEGLTIAEIMRAMGTSSRNTVNDYLEDARKRKIETMVEKPVLPYEIIQGDLVTFGNPAKHLVWMVVYDGEEYWTAEQMGASRISVWKTVPDVNGLDGYSKQGGPKTHLLPLTKDDPEWLAWLVKQDAWVEKVALL